MRRLALVLLPGFLAAMLLTHTKVKERRDEFPPDQDLLYLPPAQHLAPMSLGYREALGDLIWIRTVIFAGDRVGATNYKWIMEYLEAIYSLSPQFRRPYAWGGVAFIYSGDQIDRAMVDRAIALYDRGLAHFPEDHELLFAAGMLLTRDVQTVPGYTSEEKAAAMERGASLIRKAAAFGAPPLVRELAATLVSEGGADQLAIAFLESQLLQAEDPDHRRLLEQKLQATIGEAGLESIERLRTSFEAERKAKRPYLPPDLYVLIRE
ncbi:hypothetical protein DB30_01464 [Enhygromyxa salina]|uniref:Tetratricopeptide repeat protein n=1 Tax=Enhygromyxa salina TaxID=215803 RepID=A0A0C1Z425_9BACT|nr:hypothetical protein [Enhygromyxa salina]KIG12429.1 hypothetical protein DB30_01464 [Enhygromyxa salina]